MGRDVAGNSGAVAGEQTIDSSKKKKATRKRKIGEVEGVGGRVHVTAGHLALLELCVSCLTKCFRSAASETTTLWVAPERFHGMVAPMVSLLATTASLVKAGQGHDPWAEYQRLMSQVVVPCIAHMAGAAGKDVLWKPLNHGVLMKTREAAWQVRQAAITALHQCFSVVGEEYLVMLPESISFLAELLEDEVAEVEATARKAVTFIEELSGESLDTYLA